MSEYRLLSLRMSIFSSIFCVSPTSSHSIMRIQNWRSSSESASIYSSILWQFERDRVREPVYPAVVSGPHPPGRRSRCNWTVHLAAGRTCSRAAERRLYVQRSADPHSRTHANSPNIGLNLNVIVPANATRSSMLPVAVVSVDSILPADQSSRTTR